MQAGEGRIYQRRRSVALRAVRRQDGAGELGVCGFGAVVQGDCREGRAAQIGGTIHGHEHQVIDRNVGVVFYRVDGRDEASRARGIVQCGRTAGGREGEVAEQVDGGLRGQPIIERLDFGQLAITADRGFHQSNELRFASGTHG